MLELGPCLTRLARRSTRIRSHASSRRPLRKRSTRIETPRMGAHSDDRRQIAGNLPRRRLEGCDPTTHFWGMPCQHLDTIPPRIRLTGFVPDGFTALEVAQWELGDYTHVVVEAGLLRGCLLLQ